MELQSNPNLLNELKPPTTREFTTAIGNMLESLADGMDDNNSSDENLGNISSLIFSTIYEAELTHVDSWEFFANRYNNDKKDDADVYGTNIAYSLYTHRDYLMAAVDTISRYAKGLATISNDTMSPEIIYMMFTLSIVIARHLVEEDIKSCFFSEEAQNLASVFSNIIDEEVSIN